MSGDIRNVDNDVWRLLEHEVGPRTILIAEQIQGGNRMYSTRLNEKVSRICSLVVI